MEKIELPAIETNFEALMNFLEERIDQSGLNPESLMLFKIAFEEIIINVIHYAYGENEGSIRDGKRHETSRAVGKPVGYTWEPQEARISS